MGSERERKRERERKTEKILNVARWDYSEMTHNTMLFSSE